MSPLSMHTIVLTVGICLYSSLAGEGSCSRTEAKQKDCYSYSQHTSLQACFNVAVNLNHHTTHWYKCHCFNIILLTAEPL